MWSRAQLKGRAKATFKRNYWKCILISLLLTLIAGGSGAASGNLSSATGSLHGSETRQAVPMIMTAVMTVMMVHCAILRLGLKKALRTD